MKTRAIRLAALLLAPVAALHTLHGQEDDFISEDDLFSDYEGGSDAGEVNDPLEPVNRAIFKFNDAVYTEIGRPISKGYQAITPDPVERGLVNFFDNLRYPIRLTGNVLQGKFGGAAKETGRFIVNTTLGLGGFMNEAKNYDGLDTPREDIGQAFGAWGIGEGFYLVIPFLGPSNLRDLVGRFAKRYPDPISEPWTVLDKSEERLAVSVTQFIADLPDLIELYETYEGSAIDPYSGVRDAYTQRRKRMISE